MSANVQSLYVINIPENAMDGPVSSPYLRSFIEYTGNTSEELDKVYHSETKSEMEVNADLMCVDLCNPYVLAYLMKTTTYHHAFWPHTAKRFTAFKNILRHNKEVRKSLKDGKFLELVKTYLKDIYDDNAKFPSYKIPNYWHSLSPGGRQELKNIRQVIAIVEKAMAS